VDFYVKQSTMRKIALMAALVIVGGAFAWH
jgi:hypothetical protein